MFFGCVIISDLNLFQENVLLNPWFMFSKKLMWSFMDKVTTGTWRLVLFIWHIALIKLSSYFNNTQFFDHEKSSTILQLIKGKSKDIQKIFKYFNGITNSVLSVVVVNEIHSGGCADREDIDPVFSIIFVLYVNDLPSEASSSS